MRISWDEALDIIVNNFKDAISTYGGESILRYPMPALWELFKAQQQIIFFRRIGATDQDRGICSPAAAAVSRPVYGDTLAIKPQEAQHSDLIVLWALMQLLPTFISYMM